MQPTTGEVDEIRPSAQIIPNEIRPTAPDHLVHSPAFALQTSKAPPLPMR
jgi:hypothetical protein